MARAAAVCLLALLAVAGVAAQTKPAQAPCKTSGKPAIPMNARVVSNVYDAASKTSRITLEWTNPTRPDDGCPSYYRVQRLNSAGAMVAEDGPVLSNPTQNPVRHTFSARPGDAVRTKMWAKNSPSNQESSKVDGPWVTAAPAPAAFCDPNGTPVAPINIKVTGNTYDASSGYTRITMQWENPTQPNHGCTDFYRVQRKNTQSGAKAEDGPQIQSNQKIVTHSFLLSPGTSYTTTLWAQNRATQKTSTKTQGPRIDAVSKPQGQPRRV